MQITYNARLFVIGEAEDLGYEVAESRMGLSIEEACEFARSLAKKTPRRCKLQFETMIDGENYQQWLDRMHPGSIGGGFVVYARDLRSPEGLADRLEAFRSLDADLRSTSWA